MLTNARFYELMKKDLKRFAANLNSDKPESSELTKAIKWVRHPTAQNLIEAAKQYKMSIPEFKEYAYRFKTFYEGK